MRYAHNKRHCIAAPHALAVVNARLERLVPYPSFDGLEGPGECRRTE
jgi:hypothetical protein